MTDSERLARIEMICVGMADTLALLVEAIAADQGEDEQPRTDLDGNQVNRSRESFDSL